MEKIAKGSRLWGMESIKMWRTNKNNGLGVTRVSKFLCIFARLFRNILKQSTNS